MANWITFRDLTIDINEIVAIILTKESPQRSVLYFYNKNGDNSKIWHICNSEQEGLMLQSYFNKELKATKLNITESEPTLMVTEFGKETTKYIK